MRRRILATLFAVLMALGAAGTALGNSGYEGQPGNQSSGGGGGGGGGGGNRRRPVTGALGRTARGRWAFGHVPRRRTGGVLPVSRRKTSPARCRVP